jgi:L-idonate 5-dehydrogenase
VHGAGDLRVEDRPLGPLPPAAVRVRVVYGGICGSDSHYAADGRNGDFVVREPLVLGHEVVGVVDSVGPEARAPLGAGSRVAIHPGTPCPEPGAGPRGLHLADGARYLGSAASTPHTQGAFVEYLDVRADQLRPLPDGLPASSPPAPPRSPPPTSARRPSPAPAPPAPTTPSTSDTTRYPTATSTSPSRPPASRPP